MSKPSNNTNNKDEEAIVTTVVTKDGEWKEVKSAASKLVGFKNCVQAHGRKYKQQGEDKTTAIKDRSVEILTTSYYHTLSGLQMAKAYIKQQPAVFVGLCTLSSFALTRKAAVMKQLRVVGGTLLVTGFIAKPYEIMELMSKPVNMVQERLGGTSAYPKPTKIDIPTKNSPPSDNNPPQETF